MNRFQLDEAINSRRLIRRCNSGAEKIVLCYPRKLRGAKDPDMLDELMPRGHPLVTFDRSMISDHHASIPQSHPGIVVIANADPARIMTINLAIEIIQTFKEKFPDWAQVTWRNSLVEIDQDGVHVRRLNGSAIKNLASLSYGDDRWAAKLHKVLMNNAEICRH